MHTLGDSASLRDKFLCEREIGPTFGKQRPPINREVGPHRLNRKRRLRSSQKKSGIVAEIA